MKRLLSLILVLALTVSVFTACGGKQEPTEVEPEAQTEETTEEPVEEATGETIKIALITKMVDSPYWH